MNGPGSANWRETELVCFGFLLGPNAGLVKMVAGVEVASRNACTFFFILVALRNRKESSKTLPHAAEFIDAATSCCAGRVCDGGGAASCDGGGHGCKVPGEAGRGREMQTGQGRGTTRVLFWHLWFLVSVGFRGKLWLVWVSAFGEGTNLVSECMTRVFGIERLNATASRWQLFGSSWFGEKVAWTFSVFSSAPMLVG